jgi:hypothetical protein
MPTNTMNLLGVMFNSSMQYAQHIANTVTKANNGINDQVIYKKE